MTEHERNEEQGGRRRVKVTDKRRVHAAPEGDPAAPTDEVVAASAPGAGSSDAAEGGFPEEGLAQGEGRARAPDEGKPTDPRSDELEKARAQAAEYLEHLQRLKAEFENYRKRILREQTRAVEIASEALVSRLLEALDEFELALVAAEHEKASEKFVRGVEMVYAKLVDVLKAEGLERIDPRGKPFDPELHEALLQTDAGGEGEPYVEEVLRTGYLLKGRVLRPAGVKVGRR
ncbi:MAG TPA: nucleotide exchange factor GrpE [Actinomycetota bacterium]|nr:nucleotide exchange factor GrpE [Actinomycetota bacterium]